MMIGKEVKSDLKGSEDDVSFGQVCFNLIDILMHNIIKQKVLYYKPSFSN